MSGRLLASILFLALVSYGGAAPASAQGSRNEIEAEEYAVYSSVVTEITTRERKEAVFIKDHTFAKGVPASTQTDETVAELIEDFTRKNARPYPLANNLKLASRYRLVGEPKKGEIISAPTPIITLSRVGFNRAKDRALVYVSYGYSRDEMLRKQHYVVLHKEQSGWRVARKLAVFIRLRPDVTAARSRS